MIQESKGALWWTNVI